VEYKAKERRVEAKDDRDIGGLWEEMGGGSSLFVMVTNKDWRRWKASGHRPNPESRAPQP
jgi:chorismate synthase